MKCSVGMLMCQTDECCAEATRLTKLRDATFVRETLEYGGWPCRAMLALDHELRGSKAPLSPARIRGFEELCGEQKKWHKTDVITVHHNGLGNALFQYVFGRLWAHYNNGQHFSQLIRTNPPHTREGWDAFHGAFAIPRRQPTCNDTLFFGERPSDRRKRRPREALKTLLTGQVRCLKLIGYFQDYVLVKDQLELIREWLPMRESKGPGPKDIVVHVRLCNGPLHSYAYCDKRYYETILKDMEGPVKIVTTCDNGVVNKLSGKIVNRGPANDFLYLAQAKRLIICESTFSWWAAMLSNATEIHAPASGVVPVAFDDPRFTFHEPDGSQFSGNFDHVRRGVLVAPPVPP